MRGAIENVLFIPLKPGDNCELLVEALAGRDSRIAILVAAIEPSPDIVRSLLRASEAPLAASVSPLDLDEAITITSIAPANLPSPSRGRPWPQLVLLLPGGLDSFAHSFHRTDSWETALQTWADTARRHGWRHVAAPDIAAPRAKCLEPTTSELEGPANELLSTHRLWAATRLRATRIVIDGACMKAGAEATGTYQVVMELTRELALARPDSHVSLAVPEESKKFVTERLLGPPNAEVISRQIGKHFDVVYRPYQFLRPEEVKWTSTCASRTILGQLDMIGFSNESYHPRLDMFFAARNMQRATMRNADRVITISNFARETILAECPDLELDRLSVVHCGTDHLSPVLQENLRIPAIAPLGFVVCMAATFRHKNRWHAIRVFLELRKLGYQGSLIVCGPEPFFGSSLEEETTLIASASETDRSAIHRLGMVSEQVKWWLLANADAVLYPSIHEGFGLVPFEAANVGTPSLSGSTASLPEVLGTDVQLATSWDAKEWAHIVKGWIEHPESARKQVEGVMRRGQDLTWQKAAERTWEQIDLTLSTPVSRPTSYEGDRFCRFERFELGFNSISKYVRFRRRLSSYLKRRFGLLR